MDWGTFFTIIAQLLIGMAVALVGVLVFVLARIALMVSRPAEPDANLVSIRDRLLAKVRQERSNEDGEAFPDGRGA